MKNNIMLEGENTLVSKGDVLKENFMENDNKESKESAPKKTARKKVSKGLAEPAKAEKAPVKASKKSTAKKAAPKKTTAKKAEQIEPKPAKKTTAASSKKQDTQEIKDEEPVKKKRAAKAKQTKAVAEAESISTKKTATEDDTVLKDDNTVNSFEATKAETPPEITTPEITTPESETVIQNETAQKVDGSGNEETTGSFALSKITFQLKFHTKMGELLSVTGNHPLLGDNNDQKAFPLTYLNPDYWVGTLKIPEGEVLTKSVSYNYLLTNESGAITEEWGEDKCIDKSSFATAELLLIDSWNASSIIENTFYTEPFQNVLLKDNYTEINSDVPETVTHIFRVKAPLLPKDHAICLIGSNTDLGKWSTDNPLLLSGKQGDIWQTISLDLSHANFPVSYKYGLYNLKAGTFLYFEEGNNRSLYDSYSAGKQTIISDGFALLPFKPFKGAGVAIPVFSLRSEKSFGVGEFNDLKLMIDWAKQVGLKLVQLLPVNDTTATHTFVDSYPYAAISAFALHPLYLHLPAIVSEDDPLLIALKDRQAELNNLSEVDYVGVMKAKWDFLKQVFPMQKEDVFNNPGFTAFFDENAHWLVPYAAFSYLREQNNTSEFSKWTSNRSYNEQNINDLASSPLKASDEISIYYFVQYHLHFQLKEATDYAHQNGLIVKGDIPIGIYRNSCDAWQEPELFNMDRQAGAPPDDFAPTGQNWGFPTYRWQRMREDGFLWWKKRFHQMSYYFDAFRIDHILGFFRIWSIPEESVQGIMGHFVPAIPVHINELTGRGINFSKERFCKPLIADSILSEIFGADAEHVKTQFLARTNSDVYTLQPAFDTQRKVEEYFSAPDQAAQNIRIKEGLYDLISNLIFFEEDGSEGQQFHFRIAMQNIISYRYLDGHTQYLLNDLYENYFFRRQDNFWMKEAMMKLPELKRSTNMLICGEDLGMVPATVPGVMRDLAILSLEIQRMPKDPTREFFHPNDAPYLSVVTPSTHDMSTVRGWWEENRAATQRFFNNELGQWGTAPYFCEPWINKIILMQHLYSPAMWSIFQLQDLLGISETLRRENPNEERINVPADPHHYWRYRMHLTLENLLSKQYFNDELKNYVAQSGR